mgnify:CR=1 FL=1
MWDPGPLDSGFAEKSDEIINVHENYLEFEKKKNNELIAEEF